MRRQRNEKSAGGLTGNRRNGRGKCGGNLLIPSIPKNPPYVKRLNEVADAARAKARWSVLDGDYRLALKHLAVYTSAMEWGR